MAIMIGSNFQQEDDLVEIILNIIADYQPITTMDIWFELGEDERYKGIVSRAEVNEILSQFEKQKMIIKGDDDKWKIKKSLTRNRLQVLPSLKGEFQ